MTSRATGVGGSVVVVFAFVTGFVQARVDDAVTAAGDMTVRAARAILLVVVGLTVVAFLAVVRDSIATAGRGAVEATCIRTRIAVLEAKVTDLAGILDRVTTNGPATSRGTSRWIGIAVAGAIVAGFSFVDHTVAARGTE